MTQSKRRVAIACERRLGGADRGDLHLLVLEKGGDREALAVVVLDEEQVLDRAVDELLGPGQGLHQRVAVDRLLEVAEGAGPHAALALVRRPR